MKKVILLLLTTITFSTQPFLLESLFKLKEGAETQRKAADELSKNRSDIKVGKKMSYPGRGAIPTRITCYTEAASKSFEDYLQAEGSLAARIFATQFIDGFLLGLLATCCHAQLDFPIPIICATIATAIALVKHQNNRLGSVPYFDDNLKRHKYEYTMWNVHGLLRVGYILLAAKLGSHMTNHLIPDSHWHQHRGFRLSFI